MLINEHIFYSPHVIFQSYKPLTVFVVKAAMTTATNLPFSKNNIRPLPFPLMSPKPLSCDRDFFYQATILPLHGNLRGYESVAVA